MGPGKAIGRKRLSNVEIWESWKFAYKKRKPTSKGSIGVELGRVSNGDKMEHETRYMILRFIYNI